MAIFPEDNRGKILLSSMIKKFIQIRDENLLIFLGQRRAKQRTHVNLMDLVKSFPIPTSIHYLLVFSIYLQNLASIQQTTSLWKFGIWTGTWKFGRLKLHIVITKFPREFTI